MSFRPSCPFVFSQRTAGRPLLPEAATAAAEAATAAADTATAADASRIAKTAAESGAWAAESEPTARITEPAARIAEPTARISESTARIAEPAALIAKATTTETSAKSLLTRKIRVTAAWGGRGLYSWLARLRRRMPPGPFPRPGRWCGAGGRRAPFRFLRPPRRPFDGPGP